ncbi:MAG: hypothetical protein V1745_01655 [Patescibacteria group bacterium]
MDKRTEDGQAPHRGTRLSLAITLLIVAIAGFLVGIASKRYSRWPEERPPDVRQAVPFAPSASVSVMP